MAARDDGAKGRGNGNEKDERERRFRVRWIAQSSGNVIVLHNSNLKKITTTTSRLYARVAVVFLPENSLRPM